MSNKDIALTVKVPHSGSDEVILGEPGKGA